MDANQTCLTESQSENRRSDQARHGLAQSDTTLTSDCSNLSTDDRLFEALLCGATVEAAATVAGMSRRTAYRRLADPKFYCQLEEARQRVRDNVIQRLVDASGAAIDRLWQLTEHEDEFIQMRACGLLLNSLAKIQRVDLLRGEMTEESLRQVLTQETIRRTAAEEKHRSATRMQRHVRAEEKLERERIAAADSAALADEESPSAEPIRQPGHTAPNAPTSQLPRWLLRSAENFVAAYDLGHPAKEVHAEYDQPLDTGPLAGG